MSLTIKYVSPTGGGTRTGDSEANAYTPEDMIYKIDSGVIHHYKLTGDCAFTGLNITLGAGYTSGANIIEGYISDPGIAGGTGDIVATFSRKHNGYGYIDTSGWPSLQIGPDSNIAARLICGDYTQFWGIKLLTGDTTNASAISAENGNVFSYCVFHDRSGGLTRLLELNADYTVVSDCDFLGSGASTEGLYMSRGAVMGCIFSGFDIGANLAGLGDTVVNCVFDDCSSYGIYGQGNMNTIYRCSFINCPEAVRGSSFNSRTTTVQDCVSWNDNTGITSYFYRDWSSPGPQFINNNAYRVPDNPNDNSGFWPELNPIILTVDPFEDKANGNYKLNTTSGGGAECRGKSKFGNAHLGAFQEQTASSSGGSSVSNIYSPFKIPYVFGA